MQTGLTIVGVNAVTAAEVGVAVAIEAVPAILSVETAVQVETGVIAISRSVCRIGKYGDKAAATVTGAWNYVKRKINEPNNPCPDEIDLVKHLYNTTKSKLSKLLDKLF